MCVAILGLPIRLVGQALSQVFYQKAAEAHQQGNLCEVTKALFERLITFGILPFFLLIVMGKEIFNVVLGDKWAETGTYVQLLAGMYFLIFIASPIGSLFNILRKQQAALKINFIRFTLQSAALIYGGMMNSIQISLLLFAVAGLTVRYLSISWIMGRTGYMFRANIMYMLKFVIIISPVIISFVILKYTIGLSHWFSLIFIILVIFFYYLFFIMRDKILVNSIVNIST